MVACSGVTSFGRTRRTPSAARRGWTSSRKQRCCSSTSWWTRSEVAARAAAADAVSSRASALPAIFAFASCRFRSATWIMKNSSRYELKMARNFTRSRRATVGSWASSRTRRLNSSQESSRSIRISGPQAVMAHASPVEGFTVKQPVADPAGPDHELEVAAEGHQLFDDDDTGQDDVGALRLQSGEPAALPGGQGLEALAYRDHLRLPEPEAMTGLARSPLSTQVEASQRSHRPAEADQILSARRRREGAEEPAADLPSELPELAGRGRVAEEERPREAQGSQGEAGDGDDLAGAEPRDLEAAAPEVGDNPGPERQGPAHGDGPQARLLASA